MIRKSQHISYSLAGEHLEKFFQSKAFSGSPTSNGKYRYLLKLDHRPIGAIRIDSPNEDRRRIFNQAVS